MTRVSGPDRLIEPGAGGEFLTEDSARTAKLLDAYLDPTRRRAHGEEARRRVQAFTWARSVEAHIEQYIRLESGKPASVR